jgi:hypothetical protein
MIAKTQNKTEHQIKEDRIKEHKIRDQRRLITLSVIKKMGHLRKPPTSGDSIKKGFQQVLPMPT